MSIDQYASKVVEKCVKIASKKELQEFIDIITAQDGSNEYYKLIRPHLVSMMNNQYGNYVVQNVLTISETSQRNVCLRLIAPHLSVLRASKYGQRVASLCEKYLRLGSSYQKFIV